MDPDDLIPLSALPQGAQDAIAAIIAYAADECDTCGDSHHVEAPETLSSGWSANLVFDDGRWRVWHDRTGDEDEPYGVELLQDGRWLVVTLSD